MASAVSSAERGWMSDELLRAGLDPHLSSSTKVAGWRKGRGMANDSGEKTPGEIPLGRHVGKVGRLTLKWAWIEAARSAVRKSPRMRMVYDRYTHNGKHICGRGYIVVAHQLCLIGYAMWTKERDYQEVPPARPGLKESGLKEQRQQEQSDVAIDQQAKLKKQDDSRPGTGQPQRRLAMRNAKASA